MEHSVKFDHQKKIVILNTSPKKKGGASRYFSKVLKRCLVGVTVEVCDICGQWDYEKGLQALEQADTVVVSAPLYVDGIPGHMISFWKEAEKLCLEKKLQFTLYAISNNGFVEGIQNKLHLAMYEDWCRCSGCTWGGGIGIGGGVMLTATSFTYPIFLALGMIGTVTGVMGGRTVTHFLTAWLGFLIILFFHMGMYVAEAMLGWRIRKEKAGKNQYTRVLVPGILFLPFADLFMIMSGLGKGTLPHKLMRK